LRRWRTTAAWQGGSERSRRGGRCPRVFAAAGGEGGTMQAWLYALYALSLAVAAGLMYWSFAA